VPKNTEQGRDNAFWIKQRNPPLYFGEPDSKFTPPAPPQYSAQIISRRAARFNKNFAARFPAGLASARDIFYTPATSEFFILPTQVQLKGF
jgi:hypothetical protein